VHVAVPTADDPARTAGETVRRRPADDDLQATGFVPTPGPEPTGATPAVRPGAVAAPATDPTVRQARSAPTSVSRRPEPRPYVPPELSKAGRRRRRRWPYLVVLVVLLAGAVGAGSYLLVADRAPRHPLPDVLTQT